MTVGAAIGALTGALVAAMGWLLARGWRRDDERLARIEAKLDAFLIELAAIKAQVAVLDERTKGLAA